MGRLRRPGRRADLDVSATSWGPGRIDLFTEGDDNKVLQKIWDGDRWSSWRAIDTGIDDLPAVVSRGPGRLDLFARGTNNQLIHLSYAP